MIKVFFEKRGYANLVAIFQDDDVYNLCVPALEKEAKKLNMILTESVDDEHELGDVSYIMAEIGIDNINDYFEYILNTYMDRKSILSKHLHSKLNHSQKEHFHKYIKDGGRYCNELLDFLKHG